MSMIEDDGTPGGTFVLTAEQEAILDAPEARRKLMALIPEKVMFAHGAPNEDGTLFTHDDPRFTGDDIDLILYLLDNPDVLDALVAEAPDAT